MRAIERFRVVGYRLIDVFPIPSDRPRPQLRRSPAATDGFRAVYGPFDINAYQQNHRATGRDAQETLQRRLSPPILGEETGRVDGRASYARPSPRD